MPWSFKNISKKDLYKQNVFQLECGSVGFTNVVLQKMTSKVVIISINGVDEVFDRPELNSTL